MARWLCYAAAALVAVGCGGAGYGHRGDIERALAASEVGYCGGAPQCRDFDALSAECRDGRRIEGRTFYECTIDYESTEPTAEVCASYNPADPGNPLMREKC